MQRCILEDRTCIKNYDKKVNVCIPSRINRNHIVFKAFHTATNQINK